MALSDSVLDHLRQVAALPDLSETRYELECEIGRGGLGVVYAARDRTLGRRVALKVMDPALAEEASLIARLEHPAIVPIYETGVLPGGRVFYAMKLIAGLRLDAYLSDRSHSLAERLRIFRRVGEALAFAHSRGVIHRDLKPQNIMVGEFGEVYCMDWGVEAVAGTPAYRAPDASLDRLSDVYSLGALFEFLPPDAAAGPSLRPLRAVAAKAMRPDPGERYTSAAALLVEVDRFEAGLPVEAWSEPLAYRLRRFGSRNAVLLWLFAAYAAVKLILFFLRNI